MKLYHNWKVFLIWVQITDLDFLARLQFNFLSICFYSKMAEHEIMELYQRLEQHQKLTMRCTSVEKCKLKPKPFISDFHPPLMFEIWVCDLGVQHLKNAPILKQDMAVSPFEQFLFLCSNLNL